MSLSGVFGFEKEELRHQGIGNGVVDASTQEDDSLPQQPGINIKSPLSPARLLHHGGQHTGSALGSKRAGSP